MAQNNDLTSSLQSHFICEHCNKFVATKSTIIKHLKTCGRENSLQCQWCNLSFKNRGNLVTHAMAIHGDSRMLETSDLDTENAEDLKYNDEFRPNSEVNTVLESEETPLSIIKEVQNVMDPPKSVKVYKSYKSICNLKCQVCDKTFSHQFQLTYHIRRYHFNLQGKTPYCNLKGINQVWFESVLNSNNVIEIKKTGHNTLVMRKLNANTGIKVSNTNTETVDLTNIYPIQNRARIRVQCHICKKMYLKVTIKKHLEEKHSNFKKHQCNNCNRTFKRSYFFLRHVCNKERGRGKKPILIEKVQSMTPIKIS